MEGLQVLLEDGACLARRRALKGERWWQWFQTGLGDHPRIPL